MCTLSPDHGSRTSCAARLLELVQATCQAKGYAATRVFLLDWESKNVGPPVFSRFSGLFEVGETLWREGGSSHPLLILGLQRESWIRVHVPRMLTSRSSALRVLDWPGAAYLAYSSILDGLSAVLSKVSEGAASPVPKDLVQDPAALIRALERLRHVLIDNRKRALSTTAANFKGAAQGGPAVSPYDLEPAEVFTPQQQGMLDKLWALESIASAAAPRSGGLSRLREAVYGLEQNWGCFEAAKVRARAAQGRPSESARLFDAVIGIQCLDAALEDVGKAIDTLRGELGETATS